MRDVQFRKGDLVRFQLGTRSEWHLNNLKLLGTGEFGRLVVARGGACIVWVCV